MRPVSLYIPCYNGEHYIARCLESVLALDDPPDDIMVIDDGSTDRTAEIVRRYPQIRLIKQGHNKGLSAARNRGLREARHDMVASIDADVVVAKDWLTNILHIAEEFPDASGYGGRMLETVNRTLGDKWRGRHMKQDWGPNRIVRPPFLFGSNTLVRRDHILSIGGYDERFRTNGEDVNLAYRLRLAGRYVVFDPSPICYHLREDTLASAYRMHWQWMRSPHHILFPPQTPKELAIFIRRRIIDSCRHHLREDCRSGRYIMALIDLLAIPDGICREISFYITGKHRAVANMNARLTREGFFTPSPAIYYGPSRQKTV